MMRRIRGEEDVEVEGVTSSPSASERIDDHEHPSKAKTQSATSTWHILVTSLALVLVYIGYVKGQKRKGTSLQIQEGVILRFEISHPVHTRQEIELGPHKAILEVGSECTSPPRLSMRLVGDALVPLTFQRKNKMLWMATFTLPVEGSYSLEAMWHGCGDTANEPGERLDRIERRLIAKSSPGRVPNTSRTKLSGNDIFPEGAWIASSKFLDQNPDASASAYIWSDLRTPTSVATLAKAENLLGDSMVMKQATPIPEEFGYLSNYELVCWLGGESAFGVYESFLSLRAGMFPRQRPFKFHYKNVTSFTRPDQHWEETEKERFRKCKIIVVSVEELDESLTQAEYKTQVTTFLGHLVKAFADDTFPIWMTTVNQPPMKSSSMCTSPSLADQKSIQYHPCNVALLDLFRKSPFPKRVRLLDTTDLVHPQLNQNKKDVLSVIAMRVFAIVGHQVADWRRNHQQGKKEGLERNGVLEPNVHLLAYDWS